MTMAAVAATWGADDFFATLLDSGKVDVSHVGANGNTLLHYLAVRPGYVPSVLNLLPGDIAAAIAAGVDAAQTNQHGESPLRTLESIIAAGGFQGGENFDPGTAAPAIWEVSARQAPFHLGRILEMGQLTPKVGRHASKMGRRRGGRR